MSLITVYYFGKSKYSFIEEGTQLFSDRIKHYTRFESIVLTPKHKSRDPLKVKQLEALTILKKIKKSDFLVLLDENGKTYTSRSYAAQLGKWQMSHPSVIFVIGGAYGFSDEIIKRSNAKLSLSAMTYSHQLIKLVFLEQLYRAFTILKGESYHND